jgi:hypothetical protein
MGDTERYNGRGHLEPQHELSYYASRHAIECQQCGERFPALLADAKQHYPDLVKARAEQDVREGSRPPVDNAMAEAPSVEELRAMLAQHLEDAPETLFSHGPLKPGQLVFMQGDGTAVASCDFDTELWAEAFNEGFDSAVIQQTMTDDELGTMDIGEWWQQKVTGWLLAQRHLIVQAVGDHDADAVIKALRLQIDYDQ